MSVDIEELLLSDGLPIDALYPGIGRAVGAVAVTLGQATDFGLTVEHQPLRGNWYHGGIGGIRDSARKQLAKAATAIIEIDQEAARRYHGQRKTFAVPAPAAPTTTA